MRNICIGKVHPIIMACHPGGHHRNYYPGALYVIQAAATHLKINHPQINLQVPDLQTSCKDLITRAQISSAGAPSSNELQRLDYMTGYQDSCSATCPIMCKKILYILWDILNL